MCVESIALAVASLVAWWVLTGGLFLVLLWVRRVERPPWGAAGALLGPLLLAWAVARIRMTERTVELAPGCRGDGDVHVLVVVPRDPTLVALADPILRAVGPDLGNVILSWRREHQAPRFQRRPVRSDGYSTTDDEGVLRHLSRAALFLPTVDPRFVVLPDRSLRSLHRFVASEGVRLAVVLDDDRAAAALRREHRARGLWVIAPRFRVRPRHPDRGPRWRPAGGG
jgi:hypothetical protein